MNWTHFIKIGDFFIFSLLNKITKIDTDYLDQSFLLEKNLRL